MEEAIRRLIEAGIIARRADAAWIRSALRDGGRNDLYGTIRELEGDALTDPEQAWPHNLHGRVTLDGRPRAGGRLRIVEGAGAGVEAEIVEATGAELRASVDLEAAGAEVGDVYEIDPPDVVAAEAWIAKTSIRVVLEFPADHTLIPYYAVIQTNDSEQESAIGRTRRVIDPEAGPVQHELASRWDEAYSIIACGKTPEETVWLARLWTHLYRGTIRYFDSVFRAPGTQGTRLRGAGLRPVMDIAPFPVYVAELTLTGAREKFAVEDVPWLIDERVAVAPAAHRVVSR